LQQGNASKKAGIRLTYTKKFHSDMKKNEIYVAGKWMELENIMLSEISQAQKVNIPMFSLICTH
jgi:hypothetical protein